MSTQPGPGRPAGGVGGLAGEVGRPRGDRGPLCGGTESCLTAPHVAIGVQRGVLQYHWCSARDTVDWQRRWRRRDLVVLWVQADSRCAYGQRKSCLVVLPGGASVHISGSRILEYFRPLHKLAVVCLQTVDSVAELGVLDR